MLATGLYRDWYIFLKKRLYKQRENAYNKRDLSKS